MQEEQQQELKILQMDMQQLVVVELVKQEKLIQVEHKQELVEQDELILLQDLQ